MRILKSAFFQILIVAVILYGVAASIIVWRFGITQEAGWLGDMFGGINGFFAAVGAAAALYALHLQHREMDSRTSTLQQGQKELSLQTELLSQRLTDQLRPSHISEDAELRLAIAQRLLQALEEGLSSDLLYIEDSEARERSTKALEREQRAWKKHLQASLDLREALHPTPGSTNYTWMPYFVEAALSEQRVQTLKELREWIQTTHRNQ
jgi:hypothetical protein